MTNPLDTTLEEATANALAEHLTGGAAPLLRRRELARLAALDAYRQGIAAAVQVLAEMAADHEHAGDAAGAALLREAERQVATLPGDLP